MFGRSSLQDPNSSRRYGRIGVALSAAVLIIGVFVAIPATATPVKYYTPTISPTCRTPGSTSPNLAITLTNNMAIGGQGFGSAQITIPSGWTAVSWASNTFNFINPSTPRNWTATQAAGSNIIKLTSGSCADLVPPQGSITFTFSATAPSTAGPYTWNTAVKQSNNFLGTGNDFTLNKNPKATQPIVTVGSCNAAPVASNVSISGANNDGTANVGSTLTGNYTYSDADNDQQGTSTFRWLSGGTPISGATSKTYVVQSGDQGASLTFEVTPVATSGTSPGAPVTSPAVVGNSAPVANTVTISGTPDVGNILTGTYAYSDADNDSEGNSTYRWLLDGSPIAGETGTTYTVAPSDSGHDITFEVTPVASSGTSPGAAATSGSDTVNFSESLDCGASTTLFAGRVTITNIDDGTCAPADFTPTFDGTHFELIKPQNSPVTFKVDVTAWDPEPAQNPVPATIVTPPDGGEKGVWCDGTPSNYSMTPGHTWCLIDQSTVLAGKDGTTQLMQVTESWLLDGDSTLCRCK